jgi:hypothetical protein
MTLWLILAGCCGAYEEEVLCKLCLYLFNDGAKAIAHLLKAQSLGSSQQRINKVIFASTERRTGI